MKKMMFILLIMGMASLAFGQSNIAKNTMNIAGNASINKTSINEKDFTSTAFNISPSIFYYVNRYLAIGASLSYDHVSITEGENQGSGSGFLVGPGVKISYPVKGRMIPFIKTVYNYTIASDENSETKGNELYIGAGLDFFLNKHVALQPILGYRIQDREFDYDVLDTVKTKTKILFASIGISIFVNN